MFTHSTLGALQVAEKDACEGAAVSKKLLPRFPSLERLRLSSQCASLDSRRSLPSPPPLQQQLGFDAAEAGPGSASRDSSSSQFSPRLAASHQGQLRVCAPQSLGGCSCLSSRLSSLTADLRRVNLGGESGAPGSSARPSSEQPRSGAHSPGLPDRSMCERGVPLATHLCPPGAAAPLKSGHPSGFAAAGEGGVGGLGMPLAGCLGAADGSPQGPGLTLAADVQLSGVADGISGGATRPAAGCAAVAARLQPSGGADGSSWGGAQPAVAPAAAVSPQQQPELRDVWTGHPAEGREQQWQVAGAQRLQPSCRS